MVRYGQYGIYTTVPLAVNSSELSRGRYERALERLERIAAQSPRKEPWLIRRGEILEQAGRTDEARAAYAGALEAIESLPSTRRWNRAAQRLEATAREGRKTAAPRGNRGIMGTRDRWVRVLDPGR